MRAGGITGQGFGQADRIDFDGRIRQHRQRRRSIAVVVALVGLQFAGSDEVGVGATTGCRDAEADRTTAIGRNLRTHRQGYRRHRRRTLLQAHARQAVGAARTGHNLKTGWQVVDQRGRQQGISSRRIAQGDGDHAGVMLAHGVRCEALGHARIRAGGNDGDGITSAVPAVVAHGRREARRAGGREVHVAVAGAGGGAAELDAEVAVRASAPVGHAGTTETRAVDGVTRREHRIVGAIAGCPATVHPEERQVATGHPRVEVSIRHDKEAVLHVAGLEVDLRAVAVLCNRVVHGRAHDIWIAAFDLEVGNDITIASDRVGLKVIADKRATTGAGDVVDLIADVRRQSEGRGLASGDR